MARCKSRSAADYPGTSLCVKGQALAPGYRMVADRISIDQRSGARERYVRVVPLPEEMVAMAQPVRNGQQTDLPGHLVDEASRHPHGRGVVPGRTCFRHDVGILFDHPFPEMMQRVVPGQAMRRGDEVRLLPAQKLTGFVFLMIRGFHSFRLTCLMFVK